MNSPCLQCTRVRDPQNCENKLCKDWQAWFIDRWESMRDHVRQEMEQAPMEDIGIPLGGHRYASPHRVQEYVSQDPCQRCLCPKDRCRIPCASKTAWLEIQRKVKK